MPKSFIKSKMTAILIILTSLAFISLSINSSLFLWKDSIEENLSQQLDTSVLIQHIFYSPPNYLILRNISFFENNNQSNPPMLKSTSILIKFSFLKLFTKRQLVLKEILINGSKINKSKINPIFKNLIIPQTNQPLENDLKINIRKAQFVSNMQINQENTLTIDVEIHLNQEYISAQGKVENKYNSKNLNPLEFDFNARQTFNGTFIENIKLTHNNINTNVWGTFHKNQLRLKGYSLINFSKNDKQAFTKKNPNNLLSAITKKNQPTGLPFVDIFLLDLESDITLTSDRININNLSFKLNDNPISTTGYIRLNDTTDFYLKSKITQNQSKIFQNFPFERIEIENIGSFSNKLLSLNNKTRIIFPPSTQYLSSINEIEITLKDLQANIFPLNSFRAIIKNTKLDIKTNQNDYSANAGQLRFRTQLSQKHHTLKFQTSIYNGFIRGDFHLPKGPKSQATTSVIEFKNLSTQSIYNSFKSFPNTKGKLSGKININTSPSLKFNGSASIIDGSIDNNEFFSWIADYFDLPALNQLNFKSLSLNFSGTTESAKFNDIYLKSNEIDVKGHFYINKNRFVNSQISLLFQRDFLKQSKKLKRLTKLVAQDINPLDFRFKLSGNIEAFNFQWLYSDFKKSLEERIPKRYQKKIEESIEDIITSNAKSQTDIVKSFYHLKQTPLRVH